MPDYAARPLPKAAVPGSAQRWGVWNLRTARWVPDPGPARTPLWFVRKPLADAYAKQLAATP